MTEEFNQFDLVFITTSSDSKLLNEYLECISLNKSVRLLVILVTQNGIVIDPLNTQMTSFNVISERGSLSLSRARNLGLKWLAYNKMRFSFVMFPDDDSTFDIDFFKEFKNVIAINSNYIIDVKNQFENDLFIKHEFTNGSRLSLSDWNKACSVNMVISYDTLFNVGCFDEMLGVGAKYGAGEDGDFFIRSLKSDGVFIFTDKLYSFHPAANNKYNELPIGALVKRFDNYGKGVVFLLAKHSMYKEALIVCLRGFGGFIISAFKGKFRLSYAYWYSFTTRIWLLTSFCYRKL